MSYFAGLADELEKYLTADSIARIQQAYQVAKQAHEGQFRRSGEPYITHPVAAATILAAMRMDHQSIVATLLHDVIEDTPVTKQELVDEFGEQVAELVDGVSKLTQIKFETRAEAQAENFRKMILAMVRDIRVILVKLADRLHNMRTLSVLSAEKRRRIALETLEIYAPIANRLGMHNIFIELEDLGFSALYPIRYQVLKSAVEQARGHRKGIIEKVQNELNDALKKAGVAYVKTFGRRKHLYSIYKKMKSKSASFAEIMDVLAFRIIVNSVDQAYRTLGIVHQCFKPVPERFKDYLAIPKVNGYQSLHTTLFGPFGVPIEVQIRTVEMNQVAENGIAAHWLYKSSGLEADEAQSRAREWVQNLVEIQKNAGSSIEFIENVKIDLFPDEVYVFTPQGDIMELPRGATPVDFAYAVHSDIGNSCVAAKINRRLAPLSATLVNGQTVEVITAPGARPNPAWLNFVVTGKAKGNIRNFLKTEKNAGLISLGYRLLEKAFTDLGSSVEAVKSETLQSLLDELDYASLDELHKAIGLGNQVALVIARRLLHQYDETITPADNPIAIKGTEGMVVDYANCCYPIPGDPIVGQLRSGCGILVHVDDCPQVNTFRDKPEQFIAMCWEDQVTGDFKAELNITVINKRGMLAQIAGAISDVGSNIDQLQVKELDDKLRLLDFVISVRDRRHLARVIRRLRTNPSVVRLNRT
ncbi:MAG: bifunctional GTP diphosphokinase/guanosine-3',5'-bis pyrophosphate 3'-pyrophosphohydrolase [Legionellales bacterium]|nr:bifunctional GTP diphosphokinase/guanosine-3',5'-bis pyrophosphate 3'-pyrophosphohydrolase [Legionellales bacterium]